MRNIFLLSTLTFFLSCAMGPNYQRPNTIDTPAEYRSDIKLISPDSIVTDSFTYKSTDIIDTLIATPSNKKVSLEKDSIPLVSWWEIFNDSLIDTLVNTALANNKNALIAVARLDEAASYAGVVRADIFPSLTLQAGASRGNSSGRNRSASPANNFYAMPMLNWEIDIWGKLRRSSESAKAQLLSTSYGLRSIQISLIAEVMKTYFQLLSTKAQLTTAQETIDLRKEDIRIMQTRYNYGTVTSLDLFQSQIQYEIAISQVLSSSREYQIAEGKLNILLGRPPGKIECDPQTLYNLTTPEIPIGIPSVLLERRPDILQAEYALKAQNAQIGVAIAKRFPSISLTGMFGLSSNQMNTMISGGPAWSIAGNLIAPLFKFRQTARAVDVERAKTEQALHRYEQSVLTAFHDVENALISLRTYKLESESTQRKVLFASKADTLSSARYKQGVTSFLEVLETQRTLLEVQLEQARLQQSYLSAYIYLYKALGGGWISQQEKEQAALSEEERVKLEKKKVIKEKQEAKEQRNKRRTTRHRDSNSTTIESTSDKNVDNQIKSSTRTELKKAQRYKNTLSENDSLL